MKIKPLHDWAIINRIDSGEKTAGGIIIPDSAREAPSEGIIQAIGPGIYKKEETEKEKKFIPTVLKPGQKIAFVEYMVREFEVDGTLLTFIREEDILGTFGDSAETTVQQPRTTPEKPAARTKAPASPKMAVQKTAKKKTAAGKKQPARKRTKK
jgi:chaperonin GroES